MVTNIMAEIKPMLLEKFRDAIYTPGFHWGRLKTAAKRDLVAVKSVKGIQNALDDGLWPTYSVNKSFDREHPAEAFVVGATSSAFIVAYMEAGVYDVHFAIKSKRHIMDELVPSQILKGRIV